MYRKLMWCYVLVLTLLDISLNSKLTAQGKSHGITVHDSLVEGITFQEWGTEAGSGGSGRALPAGALRARPPALALGRAALGAARAAAVTLTNTGNDTLHLASVAGTTPDFHASFFDSKTLAVGANTTFSVVYLGRREGLVSAHLYIHTSLGVLKYPVSAIGVASEWGLWPLTGVRVPANSTLRPLLTLHNPTPHTVQVQEIYSSAAWLGLQLPGGAEAAPRALWAVPPHSSRPLVRLRLAPPPAPAASTAYIRIKANVTGVRLVVGVEARAAAAGDYAEPLQLRAGTRGAADPPHTFSISAGNSLPAGRALGGAGGRAACRAAPHAPPPPSPPSPPSRAGSAPLANGAAHAANGVGTEGAQLTMLRSHLEPFQEPLPAAEFTLDFESLWAGGTDPDVEEDADEEAGVEVEAEAEAEADAGEERWCAGWATVGGSALPYSARVVPGTLRLPPDLHFVTADEEESMKPRDVRVRSEFTQPVRVLGVHCAPDMRPHFQCTVFDDVSLGPGESALVARLTRRRGAAGPLLAALRMRTNLTHTLYSLPVRLYSGALTIEWDWPNATATELPLGTMSTSSTRRITARVRNPAPAVLCATPGAALPGAALSLPAPACLPPQGEATAVLTVVAPARAGALEGAVWLRTAHARLATRVTLRALPGAVRAALPAPPEPGAPFASARPWALTAESSMALRMRVLSVEPEPPDPALVYIPPSDGEAWIAPGSSLLGHVQYLPERACGDAAPCATGDVRRASLGARLALLAARRALLLQQPAATNVTLMIDTDQMVRIPVSGTARLEWPRLAEGEAPGWAGLAPVRAPAALTLRARNPSHTHPLLLRAQLAAPRPHPAPLIDSGHCADGQCVYSPGVFRLAAWRAAEGGAAPWAGDEGDEGDDGDDGDGPDEGELLPPLLLAPRAVVELRLAFTPPAPSLYHAHLYLRNNLTIVEAVRVSGRGAVPRFELAGRRAGAADPVLLALPACEPGPACDHERRWAARRELLLRNTGAVPLRLSGWRVAGEPCRGRGFSVSPCAALALAPNETRALTLEFRSDCGLARVPAALTLRADSGPAAFRLLAVVPAKLLPGCAAGLPRAPWESALRAAGSLLALAALALVLAAAALDAERLLRRARDQRARAAPPAPPAPLDLRALARAPLAPAPPALPARRRRAPRRPLPPLDPLAERRAFERWRAEVLRQTPRAEDESSRSSEEADPAGAAPGPPPPDSDTDPDPEPDDPPRSSAEDEASSGSEASEPPAPAPPPPPPAPRPRPATPPATGAPPPQPRREPSPPPRRASPPARPRAAPGKHHARKDKPSKRRAAAPAPPAAGPRPSPPSEPRAAASPALRTGASWSSVVAAGALPPIGSDVRRREPAAPPLPRRQTDHSLFYFNDATAPTPWRADLLEAPASYRSEEPEGSAYGSIGAGAGWGAEERAWGWGAPLRPPPGFAPRALAPPVRVFDPFHSLHSIWAPGALDWRAPRPRSPPRPE